MSGSEPVPARPGARNETDAAQIRELIGTVYGSFREGDVGGIDSCLDLDESATVWDVFTTELIVGRAQRDAFHARDRAQMRARGPLTLRVGPVTVEVHGDVAWAHYLVDFRYQPPGATSGQVRVTDVLVRRVDGWRIVHHHEGLVPFGPPS